MPVEYTINKSCWNCVHQEDEDYPCEECEGHGLIGKAPTKWEDKGVLFVIQEVEV